MVPEFIVIWVIFCPLTLPITWKIKVLEKYKKPGDIILHLYLTNDDHTMYGWILSYGVRQREFFVNLGHFLPFSTTNNFKNQNLVKIKKTPGDIIILKLCTKNDNDMMYGSWDMECDRQNFCHFGLFFGTFTPLTARKIKILKKWQNVWRYYHFTTCVP